MISFKAVGEVHGNRNRTA